MGRVHANNKALELAQHAAAITPSDTDNVPNAPVSVYVGGTGNVVVVTSRGDTVTFTGVPAGTILPVQVRQVKSTNTTATSLVAIY